VSRVLTNITEPADASPTRSGLHSTLSTDYTLLWLRRKFTEHAFSYAGPSAWNGLQEVLHAVADPVEFQTAENSLFTAAHNAY